MPVDIDVLRCFAVMKTSPRHCLPKNPYFWQDNRTVIASVVVHSEAFSGIVMIQNKPGALCRAAEGSPNWLFF